MLHETRNDIKEGTREELIGLLNQRLADATDLKTQVKQAHWNVKGMSFISLHELFDQIASQVDTYVDDLAERITALGGTALGTARIAAQNSTLPEYPIEIADGADHIDALATVLADFGRKVRADIDKVDELGDAGTADLLTGISRAVDKQLWFVEAHLQ